MVAQRRAMESAFGPAAQLAAPEEELQMKAAPVAQLDEEEDLQLKAAPVAQLDAEDEMQLMAAPGVAQLAAPEEELQMKAAAPSVAQREEAAARPNNTGLPDGLKAGVEQLSGFALDDVKVHYGSDRPAQLNALAYAQGTDIHVAPGQEHHLPHEAWHVVQQAQGRVRPTTQLAGGTAVNTDAALETEADAMGARAASLGAAQLRDR